MHLDSDVIVGLCVLVSFLEIRFLQKKKKKRNLHSLRCIPLKPLRQILKYGKGNNYFDIKLPTNVRRTTV